ncbi:MAG: hypothetical protein AB1772_12145 [Candidatus Zixiibacteriota bacterium]
MTSTDKLHERMRSEITALTDSITGLIFSFRKLQRPLVESREKVPQATSQLDKISQQTEAVTTRMLEVVEQIVQREEEVISGISQIRTQVQAGSISGVPQIADNLIRKATDNLNDAFRIIDSLQFQDITAQQMDHAASLLDDIELKLHGILDTLGVGDQPAIDPPSRKTRAFDPHADLVDHKTDQKDIDSLFANKTR